MSESKPGRPTRTALKRELRSLARDFADDMLALLDRHGVWDESRPEHTVDDDDAKRVRRSGDALKEVKTRILAELGSCSEPVSIGAVASTLGMTSRQITHPMSILVDAGDVQRTGIRRGARYQIARTEKRTKRTKRKKKAARRGG